jgi:hypothetical protein
MRKFRSENFNVRLADGLSNIHLDIPDDEAEEAVEYVKQFVHRGDRNTRLVLGYLPENYLQALIRIRDASSNCRYFSRAVEALGVDGDISEEVAGELVEVELECHQDNIHKLDELYFEANSDEIREVVRSLQSLIRINKNRINVFLPEKIASALDLE